MNEIDEELEIHLDELTRRGIADGLGPDEARRRALTRFGSYARARAECEAIAKGIPMDSNTDAPPRTTRIRIAAVTIAVLVATTYAQNALRLVPSYRALYRSFPFFVPESLKNVLELVLCVAALRLLHRLRADGIERELGLKAPVLPAVALALAASSPMLVGFALTRASSALSVPKILYLTAFSPFIEEVVSRGFAFGQLYRRARWPFWAAVLPVAILTGLGHVDKGQTAGEIAGLFLLTGAGAVSFSWLYRRWNSLWVPFALHFAMNLWWQVFNVSRTAIGGWFPFLLQTVTVGIALAITAVATPRKRRSAPADRAAPSRGDEKGFRGLRRTAILSS